MRGLTGDRRVAASSSSSIDGRTTPSREGGGATSVDSNHSDSSATYLESADGTTSTIFGGLFDGSNPYFSAGFGLVAMGSGLALLRSAFKHSVTLGQRHFLTTLEISSRDPSYLWALQWISHQAKDTQHLSVETVFKQHENGRMATQFELVPSPGRHWITYKKRYMLVERKREKSVVDANSGGLFETVTFTAPGRDKRIFTDMLQEAKDLAFNKQEGKTLVFTSFGHEWRQFGPARRKRPMPSVILDEGQAERILKDVTEFIQSPKWYIDRGIPYRRGYLLYGPPGSGKTSFITALAGALNYNICILNLAEKGLTDDRLAHLMSHVPPQSITLLEDIDAAFSQRVVAKDDMYGPTVTFSGLLNTLDGVASTEERLLFMTTNFIERLEPALIRPGRVDVKERIGNASSYQIRRMYERFFPDAPGEAAAQFVERFMETKKEVSMAHLQGYLMSRRHDPQGAVQGVHDLAKHL